MSAPSRKVAWIKPQEPSFIQAFKAKVGYKEPDTIEAKRAKVDPAAVAGGGDDDEREDELPTVVVLEKGDVGEEEYKKFREAMKEIEKEKQGEENSGAVPTVPSRPGNQPSSTSEEDSGGKIVFKRPAGKKRRRSSEGVLDASTSSRKTAGEDRGRGDKTRSPRTRKGSGGSSAVKNSSLLSFGDEEEDL